MITVLKKISIKNILYTNCIKKFHSLFLVYKKNENEFSKECFNYDIYFDIENVSGFSNVFDKLIQDCIEESFYESNFTFNIEDIDEFLNVDYTVCNKIQTQIQFNENQFNYYFWYDDIFLPLRLDNRSLTVFIVFYSSKKNMSSDIKKTVKAKIYYVNDFKDLYIYNKLIHFIELEYFFNYTKWNRKNK